MLAIHDLEVTYNNIITAVRGVSLDVPDRGVVALLGANGAGKSTILRAITGLLRIHGARVTGGTITLDGTRLDGLNATRIVRQGVAQVMEGRRLFTELTVDENLRTGAISSRSQVSVRQAYERVMELFPALRDKRGTLAGYLSGGEQQMVAIGRGLMTNPRVLLLDEPSLGLAPFMVQQIERIIGEIHATGTAVLLVEQNANMALRLATHGYVLETGRVVMDAPAAQLLADESVRKFYLGLHEDSGQNNYDALRTKRVERKWTA